MTVQIHILKCPKHGEIPCPNCLGDLHGKRGGKASAQKLTPQERKEKAIKAADARWHAKKKKPK